MDFNLGEKESPYRDSLQTEMLKRRVVYLDEFVGQDIATVLNQEFTLLAETPEPIFIRISSNGGSVDSQMAIVDSIHCAQAAGCKVIGIVYGHSMSAAFSILQACDERKMGSSAILMIHGITAWTVGDLSDINAEQKLLARWHKEQAQLLADRSTAPAGSKYKTVEFWLPILETNTPVYLFPDEALEWGVVDEVV